MIYQKKIAVTLISELKMLLLEEKITQQSIGDALGIKQSAVSHLLSGKSNMTLEQFFTLCQMAQVSPALLLKKTETKIAPQEILTPTQEEALYKSPLHLICYCAAIRPIKSSELKVLNYTESKVESALVDLMKNELIKYNPKLKSYIQIDPRKKYLSSGTQDAQTIRSSVLNISQENFFRNNDPVWRQTKFNYVSLDRFTIPQTKEIEAQMWKIYESIQNIQRENYTMGYQQSEKMPIRNIHIMLSTPLTED